MKLTEITLTETQKNRENSMYMEQSQLNQNRNGNNKGRGVMRWPSLFTSPCYAVVGAMILILPLANSSSAKEGETKINAGITYNLPEGTTDNDIVMLGNWSGGDHKSAATLRAPANATVTGCVKVDAFNYIAPWSCTLRLQGGVTNNTTSTYTLLIPTYGGTVIIENKPITGHTSLFFQPNASAGTNNNIYLNVAGNEYTSGNFSNPAHGATFLGATNALSPTAHHSVGGIINLQGYDQAIGTLAGDAKGIITSDKAATLTVNQGADGTYAGTLVGNISLIKKGAATLTLSGVNTYVGNTTIAAGTLALAQNSGLKFVIRENGKNNSITGSGVLKLDGEFAFDLTGATDKPGDRWTIVDIQNLKATFGTGFTVKDFTKNGGSWNKGNYRFNEADGVLSVAP
jgi:autotransporter-associated beta strand protein